MGFKSNPINLFTVLDTTKCEELMTVAKTYRGFKHGITLAMAKNNLNFILTNSKIECFNNHISTLKKDAYGFLNFDRTRRRILLILRN